MADLDDKSKSLLGCNNCNNCVGAFDSATNFPRLFCRKASLKTAIAFKSARLFFNFIVDAREREREKEQLISL